MTMNEHQWLKCVAPQQMLLFAGAKRGVNGRKLRLFECACCRRIWHLLADERSRHAVETAERYSDGQANEQDLGDAVTAARNIVSQTDSYSNYHAKSAAAAAATPDLRDLMLAGGIAAAKAIAFHRSLHTQYDGHVAQAEWDAQARLVRDIFGNPFRPVTINPAWRTSNVSALAQAIYADRAFDRLPILADALEDTGCDNADILNHCRQPGEHVRGCWVVDLVLGKE
jgi:hypothetical protein